MYKSLYQALILSLLFQIPVFAQTKLKASKSKLNLLNYSELQELRQLEPINKALLEKLELVLNSPIEGSTWFSSKQNLDTDPRTKRKYFRITHWNLERGYKLDQLDQALNHTQDYLKENVDPKHTIKEKYFLADVKMMKETHIYSLNEADFGNKRTNYLDTVKEFARITGSKYYSFVPEFIEIDSEYMDEPELDHSSYKGLHGSAIVSKYPIISTKVIELPLCYDWFNGELERVTRVEKIKRKSSKIIFDIPIITELRRGRRIAIAARINIPDSNKDVTVVTTHLENRCLPICRKKQLQYLLDELKDIDTPLILSGDLNNSEISAEPTSATSIAYRTLTDWQNLARATGSWFNPISYIVNPSLAALNILRKTHNPTVIGIPVILRNKSADLFWKLINFEFTDGNMFDFSDEKELSFNGKEGKLSNSNQRITRGFASTFRLIDKITLTHFRFDWIFVKPLRKPNCQDGEDDFEDIKPECKNFIPAFARNLRELNESFYQEYPDSVKDDPYRDFSLTRLSDHDPITCKILL